jgi:hypothetical protein
VRECAALRVIQAPDMQAFARATAADRCVDLRVILAARFA